MTRDAAMLCQLQYVSGYRKGQPCPYRASEIVNLAYSPGPFLVCGYHARAYGAGCRYPLHWNLTWIRKMQLDFARLATTPVSDDTEGAGYPEDTAHDQYLGFGDNEVGAR